MVFINKKTSPTLYKHPLKISTKSNREMYRKNYLEDFMVQQGEINSSLNNASIEMNSLVKETRREQKQQFDVVLKQLEFHEKQTSPLLENITKQEAVNQEMFKRLETIDELSQELLKKYEKEGLVNETIIDQLTLQDSSIQKLSRKIEQIDSLHNNLYDQFEKQQKINDDILKTLELQEAFHKTILERLEKHEALNQKMSRDIDHLRSTLFERISYVLEKMEDHYKLITGYINRLFSRVGFKQEKAIAEEHKKETSPLK